MNDQKKKQQRGSDYPQGFATGYLYATCLNTIEHFVSTSSEPLSVSELAAGLGHLLLSKAGGEVLGLANSVQPVRRKATKGSKALAKVEMVGGTRSHRTPMTPADKRLVRDYLISGWSVARIAQRLHRHISTIHMLKNQLTVANELGNKPVQNKRKRTYNGTHWTQTPEGREKLKEIQQARWKNAPDHVA